MELVIYSPVEADFIKSIDFNYEDLKSELEQGLKKYENLVYSDNNIKTAKADRASLNNFKAAIEDRRKEIKKQCLKPYEDFELKIKDLVAMIDKPILAIDSQVKNYEQAVKDEKLSGIKSLYADRVGDLAKLVPFDKLFNPKWLNATYKGSDIEKEIMDVFIKVEADLQVITDLQTEYEPQIKDTYLKAFDLTAALSEKKRLEEQAAKLAEYNQQQAEKKAQAAAMQAKQTPLPTPTMPEPPPEPIHEARQTPAPEEIITMDFRVWATPQQLNQLKTFLNTAGIKYGKPEQERKAV